MPLTKDENGHLRRIRVDCWMRVAEWRDKWSPDKTVYLSMPNGAGTLAAERQARHEHPGFRMYVAPEGR